MDFMVFPFSGKKAIDENNGCRLSRTYEIKARHMKQKRRLVVFSLDAMVREDVEYLKTLPHFRKYFAGKYSEVTTIRSIYPTITYPVHTSILTGCYPDKHGVINNSPFNTMTKGEVPWCWFQDVVKVPDIFTAAKKAGLTTAAVFWPVTGLHPDIDDLIDEYWILPGETLESGFRRTGSNDHMLKIIQKNKDLLPEGYELGGRKNFVQQPNLDNFLVKCACDVIEECKDDVVFLHGGYVDHIRHDTGVFGEAVTEGVRLCDGWIGQVMEALERAGLLEDTNVVLLSDHGQMNIVRAINVNVYFRDRGWIEVDKDGNVKSWKVWNFPNSLSSLVYVKDPKDVPEVGKVLRQMADEGIYGFTQVWSRDEAEAKEHLSGDFAFVLESDGYSSLVAGVNRPIVRKLTNENFMMGHATHGYLPDLAPQPFFLAMGPQVKKGVVLDRRPIVDEGPTFAKMLGVKLPDAQGRSMDELLV